MNTQHLILACLLSGVCSFAGAADLEDKSLDELDQRCEMAREQKIAPLRERAIKECKQERSKDPDHCERFYADYGDGGKTKQGAVRPRQFDDLPECADARAERKRRGRGS